MKKKESDFIFNNSKVERILNRAVRISNYKLDILNQVREVTIAKEKYSKLSFVLFKKKMSNNLFYSPLDFETSSRDIDKYFNNRNNELVSWVKYYKLIHNKTNNIKEFVCISTLHVKTGMMVSDLYEINDNGTLKLLQTIL
jgi:hypothetical protein